MLGIGNRHDLGAGVTPAGTGAVAVGALVGGISSYHVARGLPSRFAHPLPGAVAGSLLGAAAVAYPLLRSEQKLRERARSAPPPEWPDVQHQPKITEPAPLVDAATGSGYIRVGPTGRYLQREDGTPFFPVGHNEGFGFFIERMNSRAVQDNFLRHMRETGQNTIGVQIENEMPAFFGGGAINLERPVGVYNEDIARQYDAFLASAARSDVQVVTYLWDTFHMDFEWEQSPWNRTNGGPLDYPSDMIRSPEAIQLQKQKIDWFMQRYGNHPNILSLDLMNEIDWAIAGPIPGNRARRINGRVDPRAESRPDPATEGRTRSHFRLASQAEIKRWVDEMSGYAKESYRRYWGDPASGTPGALGLGVRQPLLTVSTNNPHYIGDEGWLHRHPNLDLATNHMYSWQNRETTDPKSAGALADAVARITRQNHAHVDPARPRPYLDTENGPLGYFLDHGEEPPDARRFAKVTAWAEMTSGAAGTGLRWPHHNHGYDGSPHLNALSSGMERDLLALSKVAAEVDWNRLRGRPAERDFAPAALGLFSSAVRDEHQLVGYVARREIGSSQPVKVRFGGFANEPHEVSWFSATTGDVLRRDRVSGGTFEATSPAFGDDLAVVVRPTT